MLLTARDFDPTQDVCCDAVVEHLNAYQVTCLQVMQCIEIGPFVSTSEKKLQDGTYREMMLISSKVGYLTNRVGSGKTRIAIALCVSKHLDEKASENVFLTNATACVALAEKMRHNGFDRPDFQMLKFSERAIGPGPNRSLIIVPHGILHQWKLEMDNLCVSYEDLSSWGRSRRNTITSSDSKLIREASILLCSLTKISELTHELGKLHFRRIIFDEVTTTGSKAASLLQRDYSWLLSATPGELQQIDRYESRSPWKNTYAQMETVSISCTKEFIDATVALPRVEKIQYECKDTWIVATLLSVHNTPRAMIQALKADDISEAVRIVGGGASTPVELIQRIFLDLENRLTKWTETISRLEGELAQKLPREDEIANVKGEISVANSKQNSLRVQQESLREKILAVPEGTCPVCFEAFDAPMFMECCGNFVCLDCVTIIIRGACKCPMCRQTIDFDKMTLLVAGHHKVHKSEPKTKKERVLKILEDGKGKSFLIFSNYDGAFTLQADLEEVGVSARRLVGTGATIQRLIADHVANRLSVLLINSQNLGSGLNLQHVDEIIIYHDVGKFIETQVVGRVCRLGRDPTKPPIKVHQLLYASEVSKWKNCKD